MLTFEEILEIMGCDPNEIIECEDGFVMSFGIKESEEEND